MLTAVRLALRVVDAVVCVAVVVVVAPLIAATALLAWLDERLGR